MKDLGTALKERTRANKQKRQEENTMTESMRRIPVVCQNMVYWKAYVREYLQHSDITRIDPDSYQNMGCVYFPVFLDQLDKLRGIRLTKAIIYHCHPSREFMDHLIASFGDQRSDIDTIMRF